MENPVTDSYKLYINGKWEDSSDGELLIHFCPANSENYQRNV